MNKQELLDLYRKVIEEYGIISNVEVNLADYYLDHKENITKEDFDAVAVKLIEFNVESFLAQMKKLHLIQFINSDILLKILIACTKRKRIFARYDVVYILELFNSYFDFDNDKMNEKFIEDVLISKEHEKQMMEEADYNWNGEF